MASIKGKNLINVGTLEIDGDSDPSTAGITPTRATYKDVDGDEDEDLVLHFRTTQLNGAGMLTDGNTLFITGELIDGTKILGSDVIYLAGGPNCS